MFVIHSSVPFDEVSEMRGHRNEEKNSSVLMTWPQDSTALSRQLATTCIFARTMEKMG